MSRTARVLQAVLDGLPSTGTHTDSRYRAALTAALDALSKQASSKEAMTAAARAQSLGSSLTTPAAPAAYPPEMGLGRARKDL